MKFIEDNVQPGLQELAAAFNDKGITARLSYDKKLLKIELTIKHQLIDDFTYGVRSEIKRISDFLVHEQNLPGVAANQAYIPKTYFGDNRPGYNIEYFTRNEIIADVLRQYERFTELSSEISNELFTDNSARDSS